jgi:PadR family transcriptional regulator, regulatory protein PadR
MTTNPIPPVPRSEAPLSEAMYLVLASLAEGPTHGYELIGRANVLSGGRVKLAVATLYGTLDRLTLRGHIELLREEIVDGRARRTYAITSSGSDALSKEVERMAQLVRAVSTRVRSAGLHVAVTR